MCVCRIEPQHYNLLEHQMSKVLTKLQWHERTRIDEPSSVKRTGIAPELGASNA